MKENNTYFENTGSNNLPNSLRVNPFIVPDNYFDDFKDHLQARINLDTINSQHNEGFTIPNGYFDNLSSQVISNIKVGQLKAESALSVPKHYFDELTEQVLAQTKIDAMNSVLPTVPDGYFDGLSDRILEKVTADTFPVLRKEDGFTVPLGYMEENEEAIMAHITVQGWKENIGTTGFQVPQGYFDQLTDRVMDETQIPAPIQLPKRKTIPATSPFKKYAWFSAATAACIAAIVTVGNYHATDKNPVTATTSSLEGIPDEEIIRYLSNYSDASDLAEFAEYIYEPKDSKGIGSEIADEELENYLNYAL